MTVGVLAALLFYLARGLPGWARVGGVAAATLWAVGSKEMGVAVPALLVLVELLRGPVRAGPWPSEPAEGPGLAARLRDGAPAILASVAGVIVYMAGRYAVLGTLTTLDVAPYIAALPEGVRVATAVANLSEVARLLVFPRDLVADYAPAVILPAPALSPRFWAGVAVVAVAGAATALSVRWGHGWVALAIGWIGVSFLPVGNLVVEVPIWLAERTLYLPSVGVAVAVAGVVGALHHGTAATRRQLAAVVLVVVALGGLRSWNRSETWRSSDTVLATLVEEHPESFRAQWWLARELMEAGMEERAMARYAEAVAANPNDAFVTLDYARALILAERPDEAEALLRPVPPGLDASRSVYMAQALIEQGRPGEAREVVAEGLTRFPDDARLLRQARSLDRDRDATPDAGGTGTDDGREPAGSG